MIESEILSRHALRSRTELGILSLEQFFGHRRAVDHNEIRGTDGDVHDRTIFLGKLVKGSVAMLETDGRQASNERPSEWAWGKLLSMSV